MTLRRFVTTLFATTALVLAASPVHASPSAERVTVYHQAVEPIAITGSGIGTVRTFFAPIAIDGTAADDQYFTGTLTTLVTGLRRDQEVRASNLVFVMGDEANQLVIGGVSLYPAAGATIAAGTKTTRPIIGGSGTYAGARGQVITTNLGADGWTHVFLISYGG